MLVTHESATTTDGTLSATSFHSVKNTPSCLDTASAFYQVLTAPYRPLPRARTPSSSPVSPQEADLCRSIVDWSSTPPEPDSSDEDDTTPPTSSANCADLERLIYKPSGEWSWASGLAIEDTEILMHLGSGLMCTATIKQGTLGGRSVTYVSKCWSKQKQQFWQGFHSELALYKSDKYLRRLQGSVVPSIMGVYALPGEISVAMEPPHHSFWIEASCDMPNVLKERCIAAFERIHSVGILHGDVELRHMLIGGDGKVTIIDFQASRALVPDDDVMLHRAKPAELQMEMRKVKYKLDYDGAREKERRKMLRCHERSQKNRIRRTKLQQRARGDRPGYISDIEDDLEEDKAEPPVHKQDWNEHWVVVVHAEPRRFIMPNQTSEDLEQEIQHFLAVVDHMEAKTTVVETPRDPRLPSTPPPSPITAIPSADQTDGLVSSEDSPNHRYWLRKRKVSTALSSRPAKRRCSGEDTSVMSSSATSSQKTLARSEYHSTVPTNEFGTSGIVATPAESPSEDRFPPVKSRDFAYEPYNGLRGYYVPHPPTEDRAARERQWHIHLLNTQRCWIDGLPHPAVLSQQGGQGLLGTAQNMRGKRLMVQMGSLKRAREDSENPGAIREWAALKKARYELAKKKSDISTRKRKRQGRDELEGEVSEGPRILTQAEYLAHPTSTHTPGTSSSTTPRSILRKTSPIRVVSHNREHWIGANLEKSPKLGPRDLRVPTLGKRVMLGVHYDRYSLADDEMNEGVSSLFLSNEHPNASEQMMLATLGLLSTTRTSTGYEMMELNPRSDTDSVLPTALHPPRTKIPQCGSTSGRLTPYSHPLARVASQTLSDEEEEVENQLRVDRPPRIDTSRITCSLSTWMGSLVRWIR